MSGLTGIALAARHLERIDRLVLAHTARIGSSDVWKARARQARNEGPRSLAQATLQRALSAEFIAREPIIHAAIYDVIGSSIRTARGMPQIAKQSMRSIFARSLRASPRRRL
jgi:pimeloyl-ACP methyl ester carboxylesterase